MGFSKNFLFGLSRNFFRVQLAHSADHPVLGSSVKFEEGEPSIEDHPEVFSLSPRDVLLLIERTDFQLHGKYAKRRTASKIVVKLTTSLDGTLLNELNLWDGLSILFQDSEHPVWIFLLDCPYEIISSLRSMRLDIWE
ncbi:hypothetical protein Trydic_g16272 [Trypoxylus dichotomus]